MEFVTTVKKGNSCHRGTWSIMANAGEWSPLVIKLGTRCSSFLEPLLRRMGSLRSFGRRRSESVSSRSFPRKLSEFKEEKEDGY